MADAAQHRDSSAGKLLWSFAGASFLSVASGCYVIAAAGGGTLAWTMNLIAWFLGAAAAVAISQRPPASLFPIAAATTLGLALTFVDSGLEDVHRWWDVGPLRINAAELMLPATIVTLARSGHPLPVLAGWSITLSLLLLGQPDASQATAFGLAMAAAIVSRRPQAIGRRLTAVLLLTLAAMSWLRPDPLQPMPMVEQVVQLAWMVAPAAGMLGMAGLTGVALAPLACGWQRGDAPRFRSAGSLTIYLGAVCLAPLAGAFPVPLIGLGASPVLGLWLGVGLLAATFRHDGQTAVRRPTMP